MSQYKQIGSERLYMYDMADVIGFGSFAQVYKGINKLDYSHVAIKHITKTGGLMNRIIAEVEAMYHWQSNYLVKLYDVFESEAGNGIYLVLEYWDGKDLESVVRSVQPLDPKFVKKWITQLIYGYDELHIKNILHRDIKLENIFLSSKDIEYASVKLGDFGLANYAQMANTNCGTPLYQAPETFVGQYDYKADIWSLGVVLYEMAIGRTPFETVNTVEELKVMQNQPFLENPFFQNYADQWIKQLIIRMLSLIPDQRITMQELIAYVKGQNIDSGVSKARLIQTCINTTEELNTRTLPLNLETSKQKSEDSKQSQGFVPPPPIPAILPPVTIPRQQSVPFPIVPPPGNLLPNPPPIQPPEVGNAIAPSVPIPKPSVPFPSVPPGPPDPNPQQSVPNPSVPPGNALGPPVPNPQQSIPYPSVPNGNAIVPPVPNPQPSVPYPSVPPPEGLLIAPPNPPMLPPQPTNLPEANSLFGNTESSFDIQSSKYTEIADAVSVEGDSIESPKRIVPSPEIPPPGNFGTNTVTSMEESQGEWKHRVDFTPTEEDSESFLVLLKKPLPVGDVQPVAAQPPAVQLPAVAEQDIKVNSPVILPPSPARPAPTIPPSGNAIDIPMVTKAEEYFTELVRSSVFLLIDRDRLLYYYLLNDIQRIISTFLLPSANSQKIAKRKSAKLLVEIWESLLQSFPQDQIFEIKLHGIRTTLASMKKWVEGKIYDIGVAVNKLSQLGLKLQQKSAQGYGIFYIRGYMILHEIKNLANGEVTEEFLAKYSDLF